MIGAIFVKFSQLILMEILRLKCTKFNFGCDSASDPAGGVKALPQIRYS